jgi:hypothetical protein
MAATDAFETTLAKLSTSQGQALAGYIANAREQMLMARSEDARMRVLEMFLEETHGRLQGVR